MVLSLVPNLPLSLKLLHLLGFFDGLLAADPAVSKNQVRDVFGSLKAPSKRVKPPLRDLPQKYPVLYLFSL